MPVGERLVSIAEAVVDQHLVVVAERCVRYRHRACQCERCLRACPNGALAFTSQNSPVIDSGKCTACGLCAAVCPTAALEAAAPADAELAHDVAASIEARKSVIFACAHLQGRPSGAIPVPCLARVNVSMLLMAASQGAQRVDMLAGDCDSCPSRGVAAFLAGASIAANQLAHDLGFSCRIEFAPGGQGGAEDRGPEAALSRRAFLRVLRRGGASVASKAATAIVSAQQAEDQQIVRARRAEFSAQVPASRMRLVDAVRSAPNALSSNIRAGGLLFSTPDLDESACEGCSMCVRVCPTGALRGDRNGDCFALTFDVAECASCYACEDACPHGAIARSDGTLLSDLAADNTRKLVASVVCEDPWSVSQEDKTARLFSAPVSRA